EELLDGGVMAVAAAGIEFVGELAYGARAAVPEGLKDRELGVGDVFELRFHDCVASGSETVCLTPPQSKTACLGCQAEKAISYRRRAAAVSAVRAEALPGRARSPTRLTQPWHIPAPKRNAATGVTHPAPARRDEGSAMSPDLANLLAALRDDPDDPVAYL